ncbi:cilia- and flagella-associated protein 90-like [Corticium candelabrum]|uniref:cilia- and flagella-associated protein 90-like n=1 Tax=Corticium candelabrum TaxID=121492 RepID=UPI002E260174|nr:cilia- and flagella-associated protein 90-like [Corticium candelabrum]
MAYPGEGYNMSNYGLKTYTPEQMKEQWREACEHEIQATKNRIVTTETRRPPQTEGNDVGEAINYYNTSKQHVTGSTYDRMFHVKEGYCSKLHRDDREHTQHLDVHSEEKVKAVPVLSSSHYGHRQSLENPSRAHVRVALVKRDFYRFGGTNIPLGGSN